MKASAPAKRRILLVTRNFPPAQGGIETMAWELAAHAAGNGVDLQIAHFGQAPCRDHTPGIAYLRLPGPGRLSTWIISLLAVPVLVLLRRPQVVVNMQVTTGAGSLIARMLLRVPYVVVGLGLEVLPPRRLPAGLTLRGLVLKGAREVISISRFTDSLVERFGVPSARRRVLNPGTRLWPPLARDKVAAFGPAPAVPESPRAATGSGPGGPPEPAGPTTASAAPASSPAESAPGNPSSAAAAPGDYPFVFLSLTRLVPRKGLDTALAAAALVREQRRDFLYCIGGSGPDRERLEGLVREKGLGEHVRFLGRVPDEKLGPSYAAADVFLLPSRTSEDPPDAEGFGIVFLEAAACGTPSLGGNSGGIPDAVDDGVTGFLVDPLDPAALAGKMLLLLSDRDRLKRMGEAALARARASTWDKAAAAYWAAILS